MDQNTPAIFHNFTIYIRLLLRFWYPVFLAFTMLLSASLFIRPIQANSNIQPEVSHFNQPSSVILSPIYQKTSNKKSQSSIFDRKKGNGSRMAYKIVTPTLTVRVFSGTMLQPDANLYRLSTPSQAQAQPIFSNTSGELLSTDDKGEAHLSFTSTITEPLSSPRTIKETDLLAAMVKARTTGGPALQFDGKDDYVDLGILKSSLTNRTIAVWIRVDSSTGFNDIIIERQSDGSSVVLTLNDQILEVQRIQNSIRSTIVSTSFPKDNEWHWVAYSWGISPYYPFNFTPRLTVYIDGIEMVSVSRTPSLTEQVFVGGTSDNIRINDNSFSGDIDEVLVWNRVLHPIEIKSLEQVEPTGEELGLIGFWPIQETKGFTTANEATNAGINSIATLGQHPIVIERANAKPDTKAALLFDGHDDFVISENALMTSGSPTTTISFWTNISATNDIGTLLSYVTNDPAQKLIIGYDQQNLIITLGNSNHNIRIRPNITRKVWHHVSLTLDENDTANLYLTGQKIESFMSHGYTFPVTGQLILGQELEVIDGAPSKAHQGSIDEVRIWNMALSHQQIWEEIFRTTFVPMTTILTPTLAQISNTLQVSWRFEDENLSLDKPEIKDDKDLNGGLLGDGFYSQSPAWASDSPIRGKIHLHYMSATPIVTGLLFEPVVSDTDNILTLTIGLTKPLLLFDLDISLEWDASNLKTGYLLRLREHLNLVSELLFDWTNGQAALGDVNIYHDREHWRTADVQIFASNQIRPNADRLSITSTGQVRIGATWSRYGDIAINTGDDWARALAHELGHYLFSLEDTYLAFNKGLLSTVDNCPGVMSNPYLNDESEFHSDINWEIECGSRHVLAERSDWATIVQHYPMLISPTVRIITGPNIFPLPVTNIVSNDPDPISDDDLVDRPTFALKDASFKRYFSNRRARAFLYRYHVSNLILPIQLVDLGRPVEDEITAQGARSGDRICFYEITEQNTQIGCKRVTTGNETLTVGPTVDQWKPDVTIEPKSATLVQVRVKNLESTQPYTLKAQLFRNNQLDILTTSSILTIPLVLGSDDVYSGSFVLSTTTTAGHVRIWVDDENPHPREAVYSYGIGGNPAPSATVERMAPIISPDGQVLVYSQAISQGQAFDPGEFYALQATPTIFSPPAGTTPIGDGYWFYATDGSPALKDISISFSYLGRDVLPTLERFLTIYYKDINDVDRDDSWQMLTTTVGITYNSATASMQGEGLYILAATIKTPELGSAWNIFGYPNTDKRLVNEALESIYTDFTSVYHYANDQHPEWRLYDHRVATNPRFLDYRGLVNDLWHLEPLETYWIYALTKAIPYINIPSSNFGLRDDRVETLPPATFFGPVNSVNGFMPKAGHIVTAKVGDAICGQGQVIRIQDAPPAAPTSSQNTAISQSGHKIYLPLISRATNLLIYKVQVRANIGNNCGRPGHDIEFYIQDQKMPNDHAWDNSAACYHPLGITDEITPPCFENLPDLVISQLSVTEDNIELVVTNQGSREVSGGNGFWLDVYINPEREPVAVNQTWYELKNELPEVTKGGMTWHVRDLALPFLPGQSITLTLDSEYYEAEFSKVYGSLVSGTLIYAQVDSFGRPNIGGVLESDDPPEVPYNNITQTIISVSGLSARPDIVSSTMLDDPNYILPPRR